MDYMSLLNGRDDLVPYLESVAKSLGLTLTSYVSGMGSFIDAKNVDDLLNASSNVLAFQGIILDLELAKGKRFKGFDKTDFSVLFDLSHILKAY